MNQHILAHDDDRPEALDALYDTAPRAMAARFGRKAAEKIRVAIHARVLDGVRVDGEVHAAARLAASYAFMVDPSLRLVPKAPGDLADLLWRIGTQLNRDAVEQLKRQVH